MLLRFDNKYIFIDCVVINVDTYKGLILLLVKLTSGMLISRSRLFIALPAVGGILQCQSSDSKLS